MFLLKAYLNIHTNTFLSAWSLNFFMEFFDISHGGYVKTITYKNISLLLQNNIFASDNLVMFWFSPGQDINEIPFVFC